MGTLKVINPFDQSICFEAPYLTWQEVEDAVSKARSAFERWRHVPLSERIHMVLEGMQYFKEHYGQVAEAKSKGARIFRGGKQLRIGKGNFFEPTLIADIPHNHLSLLKEK